MPRWQRITAKTLNKRLKQYGRVVATSATRFFKLNGEIQC